MKALVAYHSLYGNTKQVAEAIAEQIRKDGHEAQVQSVPAGLPEKLDFDFMFIGSPTRMAKMTGPVKRYLKNAIKSSWGNRPICMFDTILPGVTEKTGMWAGTAAQKMHDLAREKGMNVHSPILHAVVMDMKGPLDKDALDRARAYTHEFLTTLHA